MRTASQFPQSVVEPAIAAKDLTSGLKKPLPLQQGQVNEIRSGVVFIGSASSGGGCELAPLARAVFVLPTLDEVVDDVVSLVLVRDGTVSLRPRGHDGVARAALAEADGVLVDEDDHVRVVGVGLDEVDDHW